MKKKFNVICIAALMSLWSSTGVSADNFVSLIDGYSSINLPVIKLPWLSKEAYLENSLPKGNRIFSIKEDFRIEGLTVFQRYNPEVELYFYKDQLCEVAYFFRRPPGICLENFSQCDDFGERLHLIIKRYGPGKIVKERLVIWPAGYKVERKRLWSVGNIKIGLYEMTGSEISILMAKHKHLNKAIYAAQKEYKEKKTKTPTD